MFGLWYTTTSHQDWTEAFTTALTISTTSFYQDLTATTVSTTLFHQDSTKALATATTVSTTPFHQDLTKALATATTVSTTPLHQDLTKALATATAVSTTPLHKDLTEALATATTVSTTPFHQDLTEALSNTSTNLTLSSKTEDIFDFQLVTIFCSLFGSLIVLSCVTCGIFCLKQQRTVSSTEPEILKWNPLTEECMQTNCDVNRFSITRQKTPLSIENENYREEDISPSVLV